MHSFLPEGVAFGELFFARMLSSVVVRVLLLHVFHYRDRSLFLFIFIFFYWLSASLMSLDILLVQMLGVIGIFTILIYSLYQKNLYATMQYESFTRTSFIDFSRISVATDYYM
jgi:hypothetical protein